jgi:hypothetical protein
MTDTSQGPGWWLASDGRWYPPEAHPNYVPPPPPNPQQWAGVSAPQAPPPQPGQWAPEPQRPGSVPSFAFDAARWSKTARITGVATFVLFISLFLPWFGVSFGLGSVTVDGLWHGWMYVVLFICLAILLYLLMKASFNEMPVKVPLAEESLLLFGTGVNVVLVILGFLLKPGGVSSGVGWRFGAFVGLIAAVVAVAPLALPAFQARRAR